MPFLLIDVNDKLHPTTCNGLEQKFIKLNFTFLIIVLLQLF